MSLKLSGFDVNNNEIKLPNILWYEHYIGRFGFEETFEFGFSKKIPINLTKVVVTKENKKQIECFVDNILVEINNLGFTSQIKVKNIVCRLFENQVAPETIKNCTLKKLMKKYAKEFNFICKIKEALTAETEKLYVDFGMYALDVIKFFFRINFKKTIFLKENKELSFSYIPASTLSFGESKNINKKQTNILKYVKLKMLDDRSKLVSDAFVRLSFENNESEIFHLSSENKLATNCNIQRVKYCNVPTHWQTMPKSGSDYIVKKANKKRFKYIITTFEDVDVCPGMIGTINEIGPTKNLVVSEVLTSINKNRKETKICFLNK